MTAEAIRLPDGSTGIVVSIIGPVATIITRDGVREVPATSVGQRRTHRR